MTVSSLPLSYCTNVHPGQTVAEVQGGLRDFTVPVRDAVGELAAGLWLARPVATELLESNAASLDRFADWLHGTGLTCYTLNTFPFGNFHDERVKENVYLPDWSDPRRLIYTQDCARILARLLPHDEMIGSLSTVPLGFKPFDQGAGFPDRCALQLIELARSLDQLRDETGRTIRLAIEPEPFCLIETTPETVQFFRRLRELAADQQMLEQVTEFIGVCYDICHQAVEFEDIPASIRTLASEEIRIDKVHISSAIRAERPSENAEAREALARYVEPRYLHQTIARHGDGTIVRAVDLTAEMTSDPSEEFSAAEEWRVHFHVPVNADSLGPLGTTRESIRHAIKAVRELPYAPHLEVETYTWEVLPDGTRMSLVDGLTAELTATRDLLDASRSTLNIDP